MKTTILFGCDNNICFQDATGIIDPRIVLESIALGSAKIKKKYSEPVKLKSTNEDGYLYYEEIVFYVE